MPAEYVCACGKRFRRREHLNRHAQAHHSSSRPHVCGVCQRAFARSDVLKRHLAHHQETGSTRLLRASSACDRCHTRKERCSGELPCTRCVESGALCQRERLSPPRGGTSSSAAAAVRPPSPQGTSFFRDSSSSSSGSDNEAPMTHSPQGRCENEESFSPPPSYTATPSPYTRPQKDAHHFQAQQHQQALEQYHNKQQQRPSSTVLNLISAAAAYKSIITGLDASGNPVETNASTAHQPTAPTTTAITPSSTAPTLHTQAPVPSPSYYAETHHPYPQATHSAHSTPSPPTQQPPYHQLHAPRPLRPLRSVRQLEPPAPAAAPQPQPMHPLTHPTTAPHAHAQLTHMRLAARTTTAYPTILTPHPFIRALAARLVSPELISLYFGDFHYCWPMLHRGRFLERLEEQPVELVWSVGLVGSLFLEQQRQQGGASTGGRRGGTKRRRGGVGSNSSVGARGEVVLGMAEEVPDAVARSATHSGMQRERSTSGC
ncbi:hypothetical protein B0J12DRAFT_49341 [Macrophomina phaseolina]|uniref:Zn(2)-C6 fungal-type domain-containing protein n=1 Tax=Macrophomina phaseolina TaxID=35725 RepID=A0ABQ8GE46_9PEZI|nr:hypothetical protein B0J12DRAFT_49341 [Macrophomina phaseolina]